MIDPQTVAKIIETAQIYEVVSDFVTLRKRGVNYIGLCPFHDEKTGSFTVSPSKGIFKCFGCGKAGSAVHFIMEHEHMSYPDALRYLAKKYNIEIVEKELSAEDKARQDDRESLFAINSYANEYFQEQLHNHRDGQAIGMSYFHSRGFTDDIIKKFQLGYCLNESGSFAKNALQHGFKGEFLEKSGLSIKYDNGNYYDRYKGRVIFPILSVAGRVVGFGGRVLEKNDKTAKYVNSPESEIYHKSNELYGIYWAKNSISKFDRVFLVEGYTDVISMHQSGIENVVASSGTSLTTGQIKLIHRFTQNITVLYDGDNAGIKASIRGIDLLLAEGMNVKALLLPNGEDPDSFAQSRNASDFIDYIDHHQVDFMTFKTNLFMEEAEKDPIKKAQLIHDVVNSIALIPDQIMADTYVKLCSSQLGTAESLLRAEVAKVQRKQKQEYLKIKQEEERRKNFSATQLTADHTSPAPYDPSDIPPPAPPLDGEYPPFENIPPDLAASQNETTITTQTGSNRIWPFEKEEKNIVEFLVRYGERDVFHDEVDTPEGEKQCKPVSVSEYIEQEMRKRELSFYNPLHEQMLKSFLEEGLPNHIKASLFFISNPDVSISQLSADLVSERYQLSKIHRKQDEIPPTFNSPKPDPNNYDAVMRYEDSLRQFQQDLKLFEHRMASIFIETLGNQVHRVIVEFHNAKVISRIKEMTLELKTLDVNDKEKYKTYMKELAELNQKKKEFAKELGDRVIIHL